MEVKVPDIGDFTDVQVIEVLVAAGDEVAAEDPLITLESDKATMEVPAPAAGTVTELMVAVGDQVSEGALILLLETADGDEPAERGARRPEQAGAARRRRPTRRRRRAGRRAGLRPGRLHGRVPRGRPRAERRLVERYEALGGVCLNVGCIPSKALLHVAKVIAEAEELGEPASRSASRRSTSTAARLEGRRRRQAHRRPRAARQAAQGPGRARRRRVHRPEHARGRRHRDDRLRARIIAAGSQAAIAARSCPTTRGSWTRPARSSSPDIPKRLLVIGGGIIGLEMATVYDALGSKITVVELLDQLIPGADPDLDQAAATSASRGATRTSTSAPRSSRCRGRRGRARRSPSASTTETFDRVLVAVGRRPNGKAIGGGEGAA